MMQITNLRNMGLQRRHIPPNHRARVIAQRAMASLYIRLHPTMARAPSAKPLAAPTWLASLWQISLPCAAMTAYKMAPTRPCRCNALATGLQHSYERHTHSVSIPKVRQLLSRPTLRASDPTPQTTSHTQPRT